MRIKEFKKNTLLKLGNTPLSYKFVYLSFIIRVALSILQILSLSLSFVLLHSIGNFKVALLCVIMLNLILPIIYILFKTTVDRVMILNSNGIFTMNKRELGYYFKNESKFIPFIIIYFLIFLFSVSWFFAAAIALLIIILILTLLFPNMQSSAIIVFIPLFIAVLAIVVYKFLSYSMAGFIKIENDNLDANECIKKSQLIMTNNVKKLFLLILSFFGWFVLSFLTLGITYPFVLTYFNATIIEFYNSIKFGNEIKTDSVETEIFNKDNNVDKSNLCYNYMNEEHLIRKKKKVFLILTIIISLISFLGINYYNNKYFIDKLIKNGNIGFNDESDYIVETHKDIFTGKEYNVYSKKGFSIGLY